MELSHLPELPACVGAVRLVRRMRGATQAHLILADDGASYVTKLQENPFGRPAIINELLGSVLLQRLGISCPAPALVRITPEFIEQNHSVGVSRADGLVSPAVGLHHGSHYPGDPEQNAVYDFIPDTLLGRVSNFDDLIGVMLIDQWTGKQDDRQCIFVRAGSNSQQHGRDFKALMIDHDQMFGGTAWKLSHSAGAGYYWRPSVYARLHGWTDCEPWLSRIAALGDRAISDLARHIPDEWYGGHERQHTEMLSQLLERRKVLGSTLENEIRRNPAIFRNWNSPTISGGLSPRSVVDHAVDPAIALPGDCAA